MKLPKEPVLSFFLCENNKQIFSFISVYIDTDTIINEKACDCKDVNNTISRRIFRSGASDDCSVSVVERRGGLLARQYHATSELRDWNLAAIGQYQLNQLPTMSKFKYIKIQFSSVKERTKFTEIFNSLKERYMASMNIYRKEYKHLRGLNVVHQIS